MGHRSSSRTQPCHQQSIAGDLHVSPDGLRRARASLQRGPTVAWTIAGVYREHEKTGKTQGFSMLKKIKMGFRLKKISLRPIQWMEKKHLKYSLHILNTFFHGRTSEKLIGQLPTLMKLGEKWLNMVGHHENPNFSLD